MELNFTLPLDALFFSTQDLKIPHSTLELSKRFYKMIISHQNHQATPSMKWLSFAWVGVVQFWLIEFCFVLS